MSASLSSLFLVASPRFVVPSSWKHVSTPPLPTDALWQISHALPLLLHLLISSLYIASKVLLAVAGNLFAAPRLRPSWVWSTSILQAFLRAAMETLPPQARHSVAVVRMATSVPIPAWFVNAHVVQARVKLPVSSRPFWRTLCKEIASGLELDWTSFTLRQTIPAEWIMHRSIDPVVSEEATVTFFLHGGAHIFMNPGTHRTLTSEISRVTKGPVFALDYALAPDAPFPAAIHEAVVAYCALIGHPTTKAASISNSEPLTSIFEYHDAKQRVLRPNQIHVMGDSSGGALVVQFLLALKALDLPQPDSAVCMSPFVDIECKSDTFKTNWPTDFMALDQQGMRWAMSAYTGQNIPYSHPLVSPINHSDFSGLCRILIQVGDAEVLFEDSKGLYEAMLQTASANVKLQIWKDMFHVFQVFSFLEPSRAAVEEIGSFVHQTPSTEDERFFQ
ncbi:alpha/beta hydrolase fold-domain-containing protein [Chytriomyces cf. hyalinus JEL632]|nr:alpha/beta hydrolase fold-domain-containing protein [Chytriomyces cf. hyalinus JEL632]